MDNITLSPELEERVQRAVDNFMQGYGCCQSVVAAFADIYGLSDDLAKRIAAGFGGGVGRLRMMCGAVSGIVSLVGLDCGQTDGADREGKSACYKVVQQLLEKSREQNGSLICAEILGLKGHDKAVSTYEASPRTARPAADTMGETAATCGIRRRKLSRSAKLSTPSARFTGSTVAASVNTGEASSAARCWSRAIW